MNTNKEQKIKEAELLSKRILQSKVIGVCSMQSLPSKQAHKLRSMLRNRMSIVMSKKTIIKNAIELIKSKKPGIEKLISYLKGMPALILTETNAFSLSVILSQSMSPSAIKAGQITPINIIIPEGKTSFAPGPIISELASVGIKTKVDAGKLAVIADTKIAKQGTPINENIEKVCKRFGIEPMRVGISLLAVYDNNEIYFGDVLNIDVDEFRNKIIQAHNFAFNLAFNSAVPIREVIEFLVSKAEREALALKLKSGVNN